jgi:membrane fusion protein (multidrug efflux system)
MTRFLWIVVAAAQAAACGAPETLPAERDPTVAERQAAPPAPPPKPEYLGIVTARQSKVIPATFTGRIDRLLVRPSQHVKAGDIIARLDDSELKRKLSGAIASEKASRSAGGRYAAEAQQAARQKSQAELLARRGFAPTNDIKDAQTKIAIAGGGGGEAAARADEAHATVEDIKDQLAHAEIKAPFDGVISNVKVKDGDALQKGMAIARVFDPSDLIVRFAVPASDKVTLEPGTRIELRLKDAEGPIWATVENVNDELEPPLNYRIVEADIDDTKLRPGEVTMNSVGMVKIADSRPATKGRSR